jgi:hypothetical protein
MEQAIEIVAVALLCATGFAGLLHRWKLCA